MTNGWTSERRKRQAIAIRRWRPWEHSTGPRTEQGKARSSRNADKGGHWRKFRGMVKLLNAGLRQHRRDLEGVSEVHVTFGQERSVSSGLSALISVPQSAGRS